MYSVAIKSIYAQASPGDGFRVYVEARPPADMTLPDDVDLWLGQIAPSYRLQKWYQNDRSKWTPFLERYFAELDKNAEAVVVLFNEATEGQITLLFSAHDAKCNTAVALKKYLEGLESGR